MAEKSLRVVQDLCEVDSGDVRSCDGQTESLKTWKKSMGVNRSQTSGTWRYEE